MSDLRKAAQQALDALENDAMQRTFAGSVRISNATIALRAALAAPQQESPAEIGAYPMTGDESESDLGPWQPGTAKPTTDGPYLREFYEGHAVSVFHRGEWLRDGFFLSDIQDAPWRGRAIKADHGIRGEQT